MLALVVTILRVLLVLIVLRLLARFVVAAVRGYRGDPRPAARELVRDRVCNTFVARDRALVASVSGRDEHFCSAACRDRALAAGALR